MTPPPHAMIWADGLWIDNDAPAVPLADRGFALGDGVFETILAEGGAPRFFARHHDRLAAAAAALGLPAPPAAVTLETIGREALDRSRLGAERAALRIVWTAGRSARGLARDPAAPGALFVSAAPAPRPTSAAVLTLSTIRRNETSPTARWKTLSYLDSVMARREAEANGADEAVMLNTQSRVACAAAATLLAVIDGAFVTPPVTEGALPGITRARLLESGCGLTERALSRQDLDRAAALGLANALIGVRPARRLADRDLDTAHPALRAAEAALADRD